MYTDEALGEYNLKMIEIGRKVCYLPIQQTSSFVFATTVTIIVFIS